MDTTKGVLEVEENKNFAMVRCEFEESETLACVSFDCDIVQLVKFAAEVLASVAKQLSLEPSEIAMLALRVDKFARRVVDESENREES